MIKNPLNIIDKVKQTPPFQQEGVEASYIGQSIDWNLSFQSIYQKESNIWHVTTINPGSFPWVYFDIDIQKYPEFKIIHQNDVIKVKGLIEKVSGLTIYLNPVRTIAFCKNKNIKHESSVSRIVNLDQSESELFWFQKPLGIFLIGTLITVVGGSILYLLGLTSE